MPKFEGTFAIVYNITVVFWCISILFLVKEKDITLKEFIISCIVTPIPILNTFIIVLGIVFNLIIFIVEILDRGPEICEEKDGNIR